MGKTTIEWTDASWNPVTGCTEISPGCANCYAARLAGTRLKNVPEYKGLATRENIAMGIPGGHRELFQHPRWTGEVRCHADRLEEPLHWKKPRRIFVCDMSDLFHEAVPVEFIAEVFLIMQRAHWHTFQVLTKRPERMKHFLSSTSIGMPIGPARELRWPLPNVWCGVSVENQHFADERIPLLLATPAAVRFISAEPLLGPVDLRQACEVSKAIEGWGKHIDWCIVGGESGPGARPMHPDWPRALRDQCQAAGVPFFFKQWGEWAPGSANGFTQWPIMVPKRPILMPAHPGVDQVDQHQVMLPIGKKAAGRLLDGREWSEFPTFKPWTVGKTV